jgi:predicted O-methyltransferase YrrM
MTNFDFQKRRLHLDEALRDFLLELEKVGESNDLAQTSRALKMLNITYDTGEFLSVVVRAINARSILEIGTSNGYSTIWLADAAQATHGHVETVESNPYKIGLATKNFARSGLSSHISQIENEAGQHLQNIPSDSVDLLFLDSERTEYVVWFPSVKRILKKGGLLIVDNAISHAEEMRPFSDLLKTDADFETSLVPVGKGELMAVKSR